MVTSAIRSRRSAWLIDWFLIGPIVGLNVYGVARDWFDDGTVEWPALGILAVLVTFLLWRHFEHYRYRVILTSDGISSGSNRRDDRLDHVRWSELRAVRVHSAVPGGRYWAFKPKGTFKRGDTTAEVHVRLAWFTDDALRTIHEALEEHRPDLAARLPLKRSAWSRAQKAEAPG